MKILFTWLSVGLFIGLLLTPVGYADQTAEELESLFDSLLDDATSERQAESITAEIWGHWLKTDDEKAEQLMRYGIYAMNQRAYKDAVTVFSALIELKPDFAEAWNKRATVYYMMGQFDFSTSDVVETLKLEPRHFGSLAGQGMIYLNSNRKVAALEWFKRALAVNPFMKSLQEAIIELEEELQGKLI